MLIKNYAVKLKQRVLAFIYVFCTLIFQHHFFKINLASLSQPVIISALLVINRVFAAHFARLFRREAV